jgi:DNA-binding XRE family transcriptional regulator
MMHEWNKDDNKKLGMALAKLRKKYNLSQNQFAKKVGATPHFISSLERGCVKLSVPLLIEYCRAFNITPNDVLWNIIYGEYHENEA